MLIEWLGTKAYDSIALLSNYFSDVGLFENICA